MLQTLLERINMPRRTADEILALSLDYDAMEASVRKLYQPATWTEGLNELKAALAPDERGVKMLTLMLHYADLAWADYAKRGISEQIYVDTMKIFSRFVREHKASYGYEGFDREFWTTRHLCLRLFRIGSLEYERWEKDGQPRLSVHIPSDADMTLPSLRASFEQMRDFMCRYFPEYADTERECDSWMLSPCLKELLPPSSHVLGFQRSFTLTDYDPDAPDYLEWVFKLRPAQQERTRLEDLPENTSLQRSMKRYVLGGGKVGVVVGTLADEPFLA